MVTHWTRTNYPQISNARFSDFAIPMTGVSMVRQSFLSQTDVPFIIIIIIIIIIFIIIMIVSKVNMGLYVKTK